MNSIVSLKIFSKDQLILTSEETRIVLCFFWPQYTDRINGTTMTDRLRELSQAVLVEAIDATYAMGYVDALYQGIVSAIIPTDRSNSTIRLIKKFARSASSHWFKHATARDLASVKIYETVRKAISISFATILDMYLNGIVKNDSPTAYIDYASVLYQSNWRWG